MSADLEKELRASLRTVDPGERFTQAVLARLAQEPPPSMVSPPWARPAWLALAAAVLLAVGGAAAWHEARVAQGLQARDQLLEALHVTSRKLDVAYRAVNEPRPFPAHGGA